ncbi:MAG TPA: phosphotransferase [Candidatus Bathyarchaeia archaeon]|nr:phosphotransferase [Candidatus Bathyarchaeia archaeon]
MEKQIISKHFIKRIGLNQDQLIKVVRQISDAYNLGGIRLMRGIEEGYEDVNIELRTDKDRYVLKLLVNYLTKQARSREEAKYYVYVMDQFAKGGIRVPRLYTSKEGKNLYELSFGKDNKILRVIVMEFFEGKHFFEITPTLEDMQNISLILGDLHSLDFPLQENVYDDPWQPQFLHKHFKVHSKIFPLKERQIFEEMVEKVRLLKLGKYNKTPTHGDIMRNNVMKNTDGEYCLLDFGVVTKNYWIIDLALFLAGFCLDPKLDTDTNQKTYDEVTDSYARHRLVDVDFKDDLHLLTSASYGAFYLAATIEKEVERNLSAENKYWINLGRKGIQMMKSLN